MGRLAAKVVFGTRTVTNMKDSGEMTKLMVTACIYTRMVPNTSGIGKMICSMDTARKHGLTVAHLKENTSMERRRVKAHTNGLMARVSLGAGATTKSMEWGFIAGLTVESLKAAGKTTICMEEALIFGLMVVATKVNI